MSFDFNKFKTQGTIEPTGTISPVPTTPGKFDFNTFKTQGSSAVLQPEQPQTTLAQKAINLTTGPTFKSSEGGSETIVPNLLKTAGNIPSSAATLARSSIAPVNPFDSTSSVNIGKNIVESVNTAGDILKERGLKQGIKDVAMGFTDNVNKGIEAWKGMGEKIYQNLYKNVVYGADEGVTNAQALDQGLTLSLKELVNKIAKIGIEDPLFIPSIIYAPTKIKGTGITSDVISDIARPVMNETKALTSDLVKGTGVNKLIPDVLTKDVATLRAEKISKGLVDQNNRLKTVGNSFNDNTIVRVLEDGTDARITPIDTFAKYGISPQVEKGTINMGDYDLGSGELGKIKNYVEEIDNQIGEKLGRGQEITGLSGAEDKAANRRIDIDTLEANAIKRARADETLKREGLVKSTEEKLKKQFEDYRASYGENIDLNEINEIRKVQNRRFDPETVDSRRIVGDIARDVVYNATEDKAVRELLRQQGELLAARNYAQKLNGTKVQGGKLTTMALRTTGAIIGSTLDKLPVAGPVIGAFGGEAVARGLQQTQFKSPLTEAKALLQRSKSTEQTISANMIPKTAISNKVTPFAPKSKTLNAIIDYIKSPKVGASVKSIKATPDDIKILKDISAAYKEQELVKQNMKSSTVPIPTGLSLKVEQSILEHFGFPTSGKSLTGISKKIDKFIENYEKELVKRKK